MEVVPSSVPSLSEIGQSVAILIFDLMTLNSCHMSRSILWWYSTSVKCVNLSVPNVLLTLLIRYVTLWPWPLTLWLWTSVMCRLWRDQSLHQIWVKSNNPRRSYCDFNMYNLGTVRHLGFDWKWSFKIFRLLASQMHQCVKCQHDKSMQFLVIRLINKAHVLVLKGQAWTTFLGVGRATYIKYVRRRQAMIFAAKPSSYFRYVASFRDQSALNWTAV